MDEVVSHTIIYSPVPGTVKFIFLLLIFGYLLKSNYKGDDDGSNCERCDIEDN